jgi:hypothetical protein
VAIRSLVTKVGYEIGREDQISASGGLSERLHSGSIAATVTPSGVLPSGCCR